MNDPILEIEAYLFEEMTPDERARFEVRLATDPELSQTLVAHRRLLEGLNRYYERETAIRSSIQNVHDSLKTEGFFEQASSQNTDASDASHLETQDEASSTRVVSFRPYGQYIVVAAAVIALVFLIWPGQKKRTDPFISNHVVVFPDQVSSRLEASQQNLGFGQVDPAQVAAMQTAMTAYATREYNEAKQAFETYIQAYPTGMYQQDALFYLAQSALQLNEFPQAQDALAKISKDSPYAREAAFQQAVILFSQGQSDQANHQLELLRHDSLYRTRIDKLLQDVEKLTHSTP